MSHFGLVNQEPLYIQTKEFIDFLKKIEHLEAKKSKEINSFLQILGEHAYRISFPTNEKPESSKYFMLAKAYFIGKIEHNFEKLPILKEDKEIDIEKKKLNALIEERNQKYKENATLKAKLNKLNQDIKAKVTKLKYDIITPAEEQQLKEKKDEDIGTINAFINSLETSSQDDSSEIKLESSLEKLKAQQKAVKEEFKKIKEEKAELIQAITEKDEINKDLRRGPPNVNVSLNQLKSKTIQEEQNAIRDKLDQEIKTTEQEFKSNAKEPKQPTDSKYETKHEFLAVPLVRLEARIKVYGEKLCDKINERADKYNGTVRFDKTKDKYAKMSDIKSTINELKASLNDNKWQESKKPLEKLKSEMSEFKKLVETNRASTGTSFWQSQCGATTNEKIFFDLTERWMNSMEAMLGEIQRKQPQIQPSSNPSIDVSHTSQRLLREIVELIFHPKEPKTKLIVILLRLD